MTTRITTGLSSQNPIVGDYIDDQHGDSSAGEHFFSDRLYDSEDDNRNSFGLIPNDRGQKSILGSLEDKKKNSCLLIKRKNQDQVIDQHTSDVFEVM